MSSLRPTNTTNNSNNARSHVDSQQSASFLGSVRASRAEANSGVRYVYVNDRVANQRQRFASNRLRTAKYTPWDLLPKALFEQFRRVSNFYFLFCAVVSFIPNVSPYSPWASVSPLFVVVGFGFARDVYEDVQRALEDRRQNSEQHILLTPTPHDRTSATSTSTTPDINNNSTHVQQPYPQNDADFVSLSSTSSSTNQQQEQQQQQRTKQTTSSSSSPDSTATKKRITAKQQKNPLAGFDPALHQVVPSRDLSVGDIVLVKKGQVFPCDLVLLHAARNEDVAYVSTANLDGESSLKRVIVAKPSAPSPSPSPSTSSAANHNFSPHPTPHASGADNNVLDLSSARALSRFRCMIRAQKPVPALHEFSASLIINDAGASTGSAVSGVSQMTALNADNLLLRGSILRNTEYIYGAVIYTGPDTKVAINMRKPVSKLGTIERMLNVVVFTIFVLLVFLIVGCSLVAGFIQARAGPDQWYMDELRLFSGTRTTIRGLGTFLILFSTFIPSSLFVTLEFVRVVQALFIVADVRMRSGTQAAVARSMNLNETLGDVEHILTDKTGTLTENDMRFVACSADKTVYNVLVDKDAIDDAVSDGVEPVRNLLLGMAVCHSVVVEPINEDTNTASKRKSSSRDGAADDQNDDNGEDGIAIVDLDNNGAVDAQDDVIKVKKAGKRKKRRKRKSEGSKSDDNQEAADVDRLPAYQGQSPDEVALVTSARTYGVALLKRNVESMQIDHFGTEETYEILTELEFNSDRKRMSIIVRCPDGRIRMFTKGADSIMLQLVQDGTDIAKIEQHINEFAKMGLRTLVYATREIAVDEYQVWNSRYRAALNMLDEKRTEKINEISSEIERALTYVATTAVEDRLQDMVPETVKFLREAGIKLWVLTGDKRETAENVGYSANLMDASMSVVHIAGDSEKSIEVQLTETLNKHGGPGGLLTGTRRRRTSLEELSRQLTQPTSSMYYDKDQARDSGNAKRRMSDDGYYNDGKKKDLGIIIDGVSLQYAMEHHAPLFMQVTDMCKTVICCRVTPLQKALAVRLVRSQRQLITLAIGDGGNDVSMIQEAHIGVGIFGKEGTQAARSADYALSEFKHLLRLMVIHGRYSGVRTAGLINLSFYKNIFFTMTQVYFQIFAFVSGQSFHDQWVTAAFNVIITSASPFLFGIFERDMSESTVCCFPSVYAMGRQRQRLSLATVAEYTLVYGLWHSVIVFFGVFLTFGYMRIGFPDGKDSGLFLTGLVASACATTMTLFKFLLHSYTWNWVVLLAVFLSLVIFLALIPVSYNMLANYPMQGQLGMLLSSPTFYLALFVIAAAGFIVDFVVLLVRKVFRPSVIDVLQQWEQRMENKRFKDD